MIRRRPRGLLALLPTEYVWVYPHDADWYEQRLVATNAMSRRQRPRRRRRQQQQQQQRKNHDNEMTIPTTQTPQRVALHEWLQIEGGGDEGGECTSTKYDKVVVVLLFLSSLQLLPDEDDNDNSNNNNNNNNNNNSTHAQDTIHPSVMSYSHKIVQRLVRVSQIPGDKPIVGLLMTPSSLLPSRGQTNHNNHNNNHEIVNDHHTENNNDQQQLFDLEQGRQTQQGAADCNANNNDNDCNANNNDYDNIPDGSLGWLSYSGLAVCPTWSPALATALSLSQFPTLIVLDDCGYPCAGSHGEEWALEWNEPHVVAHHWRAGQSALTFSQRIWASSGCTIA